MTTPCTPELAESYAIDAEDEGHHLVAKALRSLAQQVRELTADAERYRWLRDIGDSNWEAFCKRPGFAVPYVIDARIDAAMRVADAARKPT